ncbi:hypothetical protein RB595_005299 [Gaeumannomyces hyphopodioides]
MAIIQDWVPPTRENYETVLFYWQFWPVLASIQWLISWYGMGKTSKSSALNLPGRAAWMAMECPGFATLLYMVGTLPGAHGIDDLPWQNKVLAALFVIHYAYRAVLFPLMAPSMAPMHAAVAAAAVLFQVCNGLCLGAWLGAYGPTTEAEWRRQLGPGGVAQFVAGIGVFYLGLTANYYHDEELREIRRREERRREKVAREEGKGEGGAAQMERHYAVPQAGFFKYLLFPHYFFEWVEWLGFWMACGWGCAPARAFLVNEVASMLPRAVRGKRWYVEKFGADKIGSRKAVIPGVL